MEETEMGIEESQGEDIREEEVAQRGVRLPRCSFPLVLWLIIDLCNED